MVLEYGIPKEKLVAGVPFYGVTKNNSKKTEAYFSFVWTKDVQTLLYLRPAGAGMPHG